MPVSGLDLRRSARDFVAGAAQRTAGQVAAVLSQLGVPPTTAPAGILLYHRVSPIIAPHPIPTMNVTPESFRTQLAGLVARGFQVWPLARLLEAHAASEPVPARTVVITFDDGFEATYRYAWPILRELALPSTIFLPTAFLDQDAPFPFDQWGVRYASPDTAPAVRPLRRQQVWEMQEAGLTTFGAHTHTHQDFRGRYDDFRTDLQECVDTFRRDFNDPHPTFAFPFGRRHAGYVDDLLLETARATGVTCALTTEAQPVFPETDPFGWGRFNVYDWDTAATLQAKLEGHYGWAPRLQERFARGGASRGR